LVLSFPIMYPEEHLEVLEIVDDSSDSLETNVTYSIHEINSSVREAVESSIQETLYMLKHKLRKEAIGDITSKSSEEGAEIAVVDQQDRLKAFACRMCRAKLFHESHLDDHHKNYKTCNTLFLSAPPDNLDTSVEQGGKICCPNCSAKLGAWSWIGSQCSCK
jgi:hypothetical protein